MWVRAMPLLCLAGVASLAACGGDEESETSQATEDGTATVAIGEPQAVELESTGFDKVPTTLEVTLVSVDEDPEPTSPDRAFLADPEPGQRLVALEFEVENTGEAEQFGEIPRAAIVDTQGQSHDSEIGPSPFAPGVLETPLQAGEKEAGFEAVELAKDAEIETVEFSIGTAGEEQTVSWQVTN